MLTRELYELNNIVLTESLIEAQASGEIILESEYERTEVVSLLNEIADFVALLQEYVIIELLKEGIDEDYIIATLPYIMESALIEGFKELVSEAFISGKWNRLRSSVVNRIGRIKNKLTSFKGKVASYLKGPKTERSLMLYRGDESERALVPYERNQVERSIVPYERGKEERSLVPYGNRNERSVVPYRGSQEERLVVPYGRPSSDGRLIVPYEKERESRSIALHDRNKGEWRKDLLDKINRLKERIVYSKYKLKSKLTQKASTIKQYTKTLLAALLGKAVTKDVAKQMEREALRRGIRYASYRAEKAYYTGAKDALKRAI